MIRNILLLSALVLMVILTGCEGKAGKPGENLLGIDYQPPIVDVIHPMPGQPVNNSMIVELIVTDETDINRVEFIADGQLINLPLQYSSGYQWQFLYDLTPLPDGVHFIQAAAYDVTGYAGKSPLISFNLPNSVEDDTIQYYVDDENYFREWSLPDKVPDRFDGYGVRFTSSDSCKIEEIIVHWTQATQDSLFGSLRPEMHLFRSVDGMPGDTIDGKWFSARSEGSISFRSKNIWTIGDFFALITLPEETGDTLVLQSDAGQWRTLHSYVHTEGEWKRMSDVFNSPLNLLIGAHVSYAVDE